MHVSLTNFKGLLTVNVLVVYAISILQYETEMDVRSED